MKLNNFFLSILFCLGFISLQAQDNSFPGPDSYYANFGWKPFTLELNSSGLGHGLAIEKAINNKLALRASFAAELNSESFDELAYKISFGVISNIISERSFSLRAGLELGARKVNRNHINSSLIDVVIINSPIIESFVPTSGTVVFMDIPFLIQYRINDNFSIDLGIRNVIQRQFENSSSPTSTRPSLEPHYNIDSRVLTYHAGLRYTFTE